MRHAFFAVALTTALVLPAGASATAVSSPADPLELTTPLLGGGVEVQRAAVVLASGAGSPTVTSRGRFSAAPDGLGMMSGTVLTTGDVRAMLRGSDAGSQSAAWSASASGDAPLTGFPHLTRDSSALELGLRPAGPTLRLRYVFLSEEFGATQPGGTGFEDGAVITAGPDNANCARTAAGEPLTVKNLLLGPDPFLRLPHDEPQARSSFYGLTTVVECVFDVVPGELLNFRATVFETGDDTFDSGLLIEDGSLLSDVLPTAALVATPASGAAPLSTSLSTAGTTDDAGIASWTLDFGDGVTTGGEGAPPASVPHVYDAVATRTATLRVSDTRGQQATATTGVQVLAPTPPPADAPPADAPPAAGPPPAIVPPASTPPAGVNGPPAPDGRVDIGRVTLVRGGVRLPVTCLAACAMGATLGLDPRLAKATRVAGRRAGEKVVVATAKGARTQAGPLTLRLALTKSTFAKLRRGGRRSVKLVLRVTGAGATVTRPVTVRLR